MIDRETVSPWQQTAVMLLALYLLVLLLLTFLPGTEDTSRNVRVNLNPFGSIRPALRLGPDSFSYRQLVGNIVAFVPLGILLPLVRPRISWAAVLLIGFALSLAIELGQLAVSLYVGYGYRAADVDDVILNVTGTAIGLLIVTVAAAGGRVLGRGR
jgi:glycopeptide antibiotics resistance protein